MKDKLQDVLRNLGYEVVSVSGAQVIKITFDGASLEYRGEAYITGSGALHFSKDVPPKLIKSIYEGMAS